jgi:hypothetical protein
MPFLPKEKKLTKNLSWLCFFAQGGKNSHSTPYNQKVKLLIIYSRAEIYITYIYYILNLLTQKHVGK